MWFSRPKKYHVPLVLDEVAEAFHKRIGERKPRRPTKTRELDRQFGLPITPSRWRDIERELDCELPPLEQRADGLWSFPNGWTSIDDVVNYVSNHYPNWAPPKELNDSAWVEAQIFVRVRACLMEALNVEKTEVARSSKLQEDLGA